MLWNLNKLKFRAQKAYSDFIYGNLEHKLFILFYDPSFQQFDKHTFVFKALTFTYSDYDADPESPNMTCFGQM